jgi:hypothetical protein
LKGVLTPWPGDDQLFEQRRRDAEAEASMVGGNGISHEEVLHEFGL